LVPLWYSCETGYNAAAWRSHDGFLPNIAALFICAFFFLLSAHAQKPSSTVADTPLILKHVTVVDVRAGTLQRDQT